MGLVAGAPQHAIRAPTERAHDAQTGAPPPPTPHLRPNRQSAPRTEQAHDAHSGAPPPTTPHLRPNRQSAPPPNRRTSHKQAQHPRPHPTCAPTGNPRPHRTGAHRTFRRNHPRHETQRGAGRKPPLPPGSPGDRGHTRLAPHRTCAIRRGESDVIRASSARRPVPAPRPCSTTTGGCLRRTRRMARSHPAGRLCP